MQQRTKGQPGWRTIAIACALLAAILPPAARLAAGPQGATVHVRWQASVDDATRQRLEERLGLADPRALDAATWQYDLINPSRNTIRAVVTDAAVEDTHHLDRSSYALDPGAARTGRRTRFAAGSMIVAAADRIAIALAALALLLVLLAAAGRAPTAAGLAQGLARAIRMLRPPDADAPPGDARVSVAEDRHSPERPGAWTAAVMLAAIPLVGALCFTLWTTPYPITEAVAMFEDIEEQPVTRFLSPYRAYFRPASYAAFSAIWHGAPSQDAALVLLRLMTLVPVVVLVLLFVWHLRPRTAIEAGAAAAAVAVLVGSPGFRDNIEVGIPDTIIGMAAVFIAWVVLNQPRRWWHPPALLACALIAIGFKEQGLVIVPLIIGAWWARAPGATRTMAITAAVIAVGYIALRLVGSSAWAPFEQDVGFGFSEINAKEAAVQFGRFLPVIYVYNAAATVSNVLFAEPTRGVFEVVRAILDARVQPWQVLQVASSAGLTIVIAWWGIAALRSTRRAGWTIEARLFLVSTIVLLAAGALSFNYSRERLAGMAAVFYAAAAFFALRAAAVRLVDAPRRRLVAGGLALTLLAAAWHVRAVGTLESARVHSWGNQREWFVLIDRRRIDFGHRPIYMRIMESMVEQGRNPDAPRPTHFPGPIAMLLGPPR